MSSSYELENDLNSEIKTSNLIHQVIDPILNQYDQIVKSYALFNLLFISIGVLEIFLLLFFFTFITQSAILSLCLALVFLTFFSYFILRLYFQAQKSDQLLALKETYIRSCKQTLNYREQNPDHYIALANSCSKLADAFQGRESFSIPLPEQLMVLKPYLERFSRWCHWQDVHKMREYLLLAAIDENIRFVKQEPTNLEAHAALANGYIMLSSLYMEPTKQEAIELMPWILKDANLAIFEKKYRQAAERAIEEFKIIKQFAPDDPWVLAQLAYSYHDLQMPLEEIAEYETLLQLNPEDQEALFKLGTLYFQQGMNAKGLVIYDQLKASDQHRAEELIKFYGTFQPFQLH